MSTAGTPNDALGSGQLWVSPLGEDVKLSEYITSFLEGNSDAKDATLYPILNLPEDDDTHPLADYFISTSHNTYLLHNQLYGSPSPLSYTHVLSRHARCVEIDAWDSSSSSTSSSTPSESVIVTHGHTLVKSIPFRAVVEAIGAAVDDDPQGWPVWVALENHTGWEGQAEIVSVVREVWGEKLVTQELTGITEVTPRDLRGKILMEIEWYPAVAASSAPSHVSAFGKIDDEVKKLVKEVDPDMVPRIIPELAALGVYAHSIKPEEGFLTQMVKEPMNYLLNISESSLAKLLPTSMVALIANNGKHIMRVYPEGIRIDSENLDPLRFWRAGAQMPALNWQTFDRGMQLNEGFFTGTKGWILKPPCLRTDSEGVEARSGQVSVTLDVVAGCGLPRPTNVGDDKEFRVDCQGEILHSSGDQVQRTTRTDDVDSVHDAGGEDPVWNQSLVWTYEDEDLVMFRLLVVHQKWDGEAPVAVFCGRVDCLQQGWRLVRLLDMTGRPTDGTLLLRFTITK